MPMRSMNAAGVPVVLDPVGAGATRFRTETAARILAGELGRELGIQGHRERALVDHLEVVLLYPLDLHAFGGEREGPLADGHLHACSRQNRVDVRKRESLDPCGGSLHVLAQQLSQRTEVRLCPVFHQLVLVLTEDE